MSKDFEPKKAILEEIEGLMTVRKAIAHLVRQAEQKIAEAEIELNAARCTEGFVKIELERKQAILREIIENEKNKSEQ